MVLLVFCVPVRDEALDDGLVGLLVGPACKCVDRDVGGGGAGVQQEGWGVVEVDYML